MQARLFLALTFGALTLATTSCKKGFGTDFEGTITMKVHTGTQDSDMLVTTKNEKMRFDIGSQSGGKYMLFDPKTNAVTMVDDSTKTFSVLDFKSPSAPQANTSPETAAIDKTGKHETIAGIDCENWIAKDPSGKRSEVCIAQGIAFFDIGSMKSGSSGGGLAKELREKKLFPLRDVEYDAASKEVSRMEVTKVEKKSIDDAKLDVPKDYSKLTLPGM